MKKTIIITLGILLIAFNVSLSNAGKKPKPPNDVPPLTVTVNAPTECYRGGPIQITVDAQSDIGISHVLHSMYSTWDYRGIDITHPETQIFTQVPFTKNDICGSLIGPMYLNFIAVDKMGQPSEPLSKTVNVVPSPPELFLVLVNSCNDIGGNLDFRAHNKGDVESTGFYIDIYYTETEPVVGQAGDASVYIDSLKPDETRFFGFPYPYCNTPINCWVQIDTYNDVNEPYEGNNTLYIDANSLP